MQGPGGRRLTQRDFLAAALIVLGTAALFVIDVSQPRGVVDGVGYAAVVALTIRFGRRALVATAAITTVLTLIAAGLLPDAGISVAGMWANRGFAIASIWIIAVLLLHRLNLETELEDRDSLMRRHQAALAQMVRDGVLLDGSFEDRLMRVCRIGVEALEAEGGAFFLRNPDNRTVTVLQAWRRTDKPFFVVGARMDEDPNHKARLIQELVVATDDMEVADQYAGLRPGIRRLGLRATLAAEVFHGSTSSATVGFTHAVPHRWTEQEKAFARATASLVALLISVQRNSETLAALDLAGDGLYTEDEKGRVTYSNRAARFYARDTPEGPDYPRPAIALSRERDRHEIAFEGRDLEIHRTRLPGGGLIARIADVSERNRANTERARLEARLHQSAKMEAIGQLAGGVSHDFNNILAAIAGFAGFIAQDSEGGTENRGFARRILGACDRGKELVDQIVAFADTGAGAQGKVDLGQALRRCQDLLAAGMHPGAMLEVELPEQPLWIQGNEVQIGQLVSNLVVNARDALEGKGGSIELGAVLAGPEEIAGLRGKTGPRTLLFGELNSGRRYVRLRVSDTGSGIAPEIMDRVFQPFFSTKGREHGTGLGLAVVHNVVMAHGGACHLESEIGKGTAFSIYLPQAPSAPGTATAQPFSKPCHVLIVDDEADMIDLLSIGLERLGFDTVAVQDPREALAAVEEDPAAFDAVLTDYDMAVMPGTELIRRIKAVAPAIRIVLCTGHRDFNEEAALSAGADAFLRKPVDIETVAYCLSRPPAAYAN